MKKIVCILLLLLSLAACKQGEYKIISLEDLSKIEPDRSISIDSIADRMDYVLLELNDSCLIGDVSGIVECKDCYIISSSKTGNICKYSKDGKFLSAIGKKGEGPEEYISPKNMAVDSLENIYVLDYFGRKMLMYNMDGKFIGSHKLPSDYNFASFSLFENGILYLSTANSVNLALLYYDFTSKDFKTIWKTEREMKAGELMVGSTFVYANKDIFLQHYFNDTIYRYCDKQFVPDHLLVLGKRSLTFEEVSGFDQPMDGPKIQIASIKRTDKYSFIFYTVSKYEDVVFKRFMAMYSNDYSLFYPHINFINSEYPQFSIKDGEFFTIQGNALLLSKENVSMDGDKEDEENLVLIKYHLK